MKPLPACLLLLATLCSGTLHAAEDTSPKSCDAVKALQTAEKYAEAQEAAQALVAARTQELGADHPETRRARLLLAAVLADQGSLAAAEKEYRQALQLPAPASQPARTITKNPYTHAPQTLGGSTTPGMDPAKIQPKPSPASSPTAADQESLLALRSFTSLLTEQGKLVEAETQLRELLPRMAQAFGKEHRETLRCQSDLISVLASQSAFAEAEELSRTLIPTATRVLGAEDPDTLKARGDFAAALFYQGKLKQAAAELRQLLAISARVLGAEGRETLRTQFMLAKLLRVQDQDAAAEPRLRELLPVMSRVFGAENLETLVCQSELLATQASLGKNAEVESPYRLLIPVLKRVLGPADDITLKTRWRFAGVLFALGKREAAELENRQALDASLRGLAITDRTSLISPYTEATDMYIAARYAEAEPWRRQLISLQTSLLGAEHPSTLQSRAELAGDLDGQGKKTAAETELRAVLALQQRVLGAQHPDTLDTCCSLAENLLAQKRPRDARPFAQRALDGRRQLFGKDHATTRVAQLLVEDITHSALPPAKTAPESESAPGPTQAPAPAPVPKPDDRTLVIVDGTPILASDLQIALISGEHSLRYDLWSQPRQLERKLAEMKASMLDTLITQMLLIHEYKRLGGTMKPEYVDEDIERITKSTFKGDRAALRTAVAKEGMSWDDYRLRRERALMEYWMRRRIEDSVPDTFKDEELENYYDKNKKRWRGPVEVKLHTLTLLKTTHLSDAETRRQMEALRARITKGGDFAEIARVESKDSHADDGGAWDWTPLSDLSEDIRSAAAKTQKGRLSAIIEETGHFILLQVDDRRSTPAPPFEKVKTEVAKALREEKGRKSIEHRIYKLRETASIQKPGPV